MHHLKENYNHKEDAISNLSNRIGAYGKVPAQTTALIMPNMRPDFLPAKNNYQIAESSELSMHQFIPKPIEYKQFESFEMSKNVKQPYYFAEQDHAERSQKPDTRSCPNCVQSIVYFQLTNDPTDSVFCVQCRQPYHFCRVHGTALPGMGRNQRDPQLQECQCTRSQSFLGDNNWNSCFNK